MPLQATRLSNNTTSCHMRCMRRSSRPPAPADLPPSLRVQRSTMQTVLSLLPYLWPVGNRARAIRVVVALIFMVLSKVATVYVPVIYGRIVNSLAPKDAAAIFAVPVALILAYGAIRVGSAGFGEIRDALFASVQQRAVRLLALRTFRHLHSVSLRFHLDRQTGGLSRVIDRGVLGHAVRAAPRRLQRRSDRAGVDDGDRHHLAHVRLALRAS